MRIAFFTYADPEVAGGVQEYTFQLSQALEKRGHAVTVFGPEGKSVLPFSKYRPVCRKITVPSPNGNWTTNTLPFATKPSVASIINRGNFDILHIQDPWVPFVGFDLIGNVTVPKVATINSGWESASPAAGIMNFVLPFFRDVALKSNIGVIFISKHAQSCWRPLIPESIPQKVIYYGVDPHFRPDSRKPVQKDGGKLLFVGRLVRRKGLRFLLEAMTKLKREFPHLSLDVVGDGIERPMLARFVKNHKMADRVNFHGQIAGPERVRFFQNASVFCAPYVDEGFGLTIIESIAAGLPVVGFANGAFDESLGHYPEKSLMTEEHSAPALAKALRLLLKNAALQKKIREWMLSQRPKYTWEKTAAETEKFYFEILKQKAA